MHTGACLSDELLLIDDQLEFQSQLIRSFSAKDHALKEDFKIIHHRAVSGVNMQLEYSKNYEKVHS